MSDEYKTEDLFLQQQDDAWNEQMQTLESAGYEESIMDRWDRWDRWVKAMKG